MSLMPAPRLVTDWSKPMLEVRSVERMRTETKSVRTGSRRALPSASSSTSCEPPR